MEALRARREALIAAAAALLCAACAQRGGLSRLGVRADVVEPPRAVATPGGAVAVYELEVRNAGDGAVELTSVARRRSDRAGEDELAADALARRVVPRRRAATAADRLRLPPGERVVVLLDAAFAAGAAVPSFEHDVRVRTERGARDVATAAERPADPAAPVEIAAPVRGPGWLVENGPATLSGHRCAVVWTHRTPRAAQRFAVDFFRVGADGRTSRGDGARNDDHHAFGADVVAVADGVVVAAVDGVPDNAPHPSERAVEMSAATVAGNHVVQDLGGGRFAVYAHLREGSVAVRPGDRVARGRLLGNLGNSGNSTEPHLHFHVADGPSPVEASGLPFVLDAFVDRGGGAAVPRQGVLPSESSIVDFGRDDHHATTGAPNADATR